MSRAGYAPSIAMFGQQSAYVNKQRPCKIQDVWIAKYQWSILRAGTRPRAGKQEFNSWHRQDFFPPHYFLIVFGLHPLSNPMDTAGSFPGIKRPGRNADHFPPSSAGVKNVQTPCFLTPPYVYQFKRDNNYIVHNLCLSSHIIRMIE